MPSALLVLIGFMLSLLLGVNEKKSILDREQLLRKPLILRLRLSFSLALSPQNIGSVRPFSPPLLREGFGFISGHPLDIKKCRVSQWEIQLVKIIALLLCKGNQYREVSSRGFVTMRTVEGGGQTCQAAVDQGRGVPLPVSGGRSTDFQVPFK